MSSTGALRPRLYFTVNLSCNIKNSVHPFCYGKGSDNRQNGIQIFGRFGSDFSKLFPTRQTVFRTPLVRRSTRLRDSKIRSGK
jgi:hypothetical protein